MKTTSEVEVCPLSSSAMDNYSRHFAKNLTEIRNAICKDYLLKRVDEERGEEDGNTHEFKISRITISLSWHVSTQKIIKKEIFLMPICQLEFFGGKKFSFFALDFDVKWSSNFPYLSLIFATSHIFFKKYPISPKIFSPFQICFTFGYINKKIQIKNEFSMICR